MHRLAPWLIFLFLAFAGASLRHTTENLGINTDTAGMISRTLPFRISYERYGKAFPEQVDRLVVVVDAETPEQADQAAHLLERLLMQQPDVFANVYVPGSDDFFKRNAFLYLDPAELEQLSESLEQIQPLLERLNQDQSLSNLGNLLTAALRQSESGTNPPLDELIAELQRTLEATIDNRPRNLSWQTVLQQRTDPRQDLRRYLHVKPILDFSEPLAAEPAILAVREASGLVNDRFGGAVRVRITGDAALGYEELVSAMAGAQIAGVLALIMVAVILFVGLGSAWLVIAALVTLICGLIFTAGFATLAIGHLNLISIAFAVLYIGLGVDYAIHLCLRYREELQQLQEKLPAIRQAVKSVRGSLMLCTVTTATGFYAFVPTDFSGVSELGLIAGTGMFINLFCSLILLPALLLVIPKPVALTPATAGSVISRLRDAPIRFARPIKIGALVIGAGAVLLLPQLEFDRNPLNLRDAESESVATLLELMSEGESAAMSITVIGDDAQTSATQASALRKLPTVADVHSIDDLLPDVSDEKLAHIDGIKASIGAALTPSADSRYYNTAETLAALEQLRSTLLDFSAHNNSTQTGQQASSSAELIGELLAGTEPDILIAELQRRLFEDLNKSLEGLSRALAPADYTIDDLPPYMRTRWVNDDGLYRLSVSPREDINDNDALRRFVDDVQAIIPDATDEPVISLKAGDAVIRAFQQAFATALALITIILMVLLRDPRATLYVLAPLTLASLLTAAVMAILNLPFNFANIIALPLLFGIGVDNAIHMVHRARHQPGDILNPLMTSTARAVLFSSLTTICSFGNLLFSPHPGTASMGFLLAVGVALMIISTLVLLPALLHKG
jgi:hopanoid biosynthesis associated RND transporter like protein HpnN